MNKESKNKVVLIHWDLSTLSQSTFSSDLVAFNSFASENSFTELYRFLFEFVGEIGADGVFIRFQKNHVTDNVLFTSISFF